MIKFIRYFVVGGLSAILDFTIFATLVSLAGWPWYIAATVSFVAATLFNYLISIRHVFTSGVRFERTHEVALTFLVSGVGLGINQAILYLLIGWGINILLAKIGATGVVFFWNFSVRYLFVFREPLPRS